MKRRDLLLATPLALRLTATVCAELSEPTDSLHRSGRRWRRQRLRRAHRHRAMEQADRCDVRGRQPGWRWRCHRVPNRQRRPPPDGYTLMQGYVATHGTCARDPQGAVRPDQGLHSDRHDRRHAETCWWSTAIARTGDVAASSSMYLQKNPGKVNYGSAGAGSLTHLTMELFKQQVASFMVHIPYRGVAPAFTDLIGGQTQAMFPGLGSGDAAHSFGPRTSARSDRRCASSAAEGHADDDRTRVSKDSTRCSGTASSARPAFRRLIVKQLNASLESVLKAPDLSERLAGRGSRADADDVGSSSAPTFSSEVARWTKLARERNIQLDS